MSARRRQCRLNEEEKELIGDIDDLMLTEWTDPDCKWRGVGNGGFGSVVVCAKMLKNIETDTFVYKMSNAEDEDCLQREVALQHAASNKSKNVMEVLGLWTNGYLNIIKMPANSVGINGLNSSDIMKRMRGESRFIKSKSLLCNSFVCDVSTAVNAIHSIHIYHFDIKLENVVFSFEDGMYRLIDFGGARKFISEEDNDYVFGSAPYLPPEMPNNDLTPIKMKRKNIGPAYAPNSRKVDLFELGMSIVYLVEPTCLKLYFNSTRVNENGHNNIETLRKQSHKECIDTFKESKYYKSLSQSQKKFVDDLPCFDPYVREMGDVSLFHISKDVRDELRSLRSDEDYDAFHASRTSNGGSGGQVDSTMIEDVPLQSLNGRPGDESAAEQDAPVPRRSPGGESGDVNQLMSPTYVSQMNDSGGGTDGAVRPDEFEFSEYPGFLR